MRGVTYMDTTSVHFARPSDHDIFRDAMNFFLFFLLFRYDHVLRPRLPTNLFPPVRL